MKTVNPKLLAVLALAVVLTGYLKLSNPYKEYSRQAFWQTATVDDVYKVPEEALRPGNQNGPVLMWAATATKDPQVIAALVARGADVNEADTGAFSGTPLSAAAGYASNPRIIDELIRLGADINKVVGSSAKTPLIIAAELNKNPEIINSLIRHGADVAYRDATGHTALEQARRVGNPVAVTVLEAYEE